MMVGVTGVIRGVIEGENRGYIAGIAFNDVVF